MSEVLISVITATVGRRELMLRKLASLEAQTVAPESFELIVCVNGTEVPAGNEAAESLDPAGTAESLERSSPSFGLTVVRTATNLGPAVARNVAARRARGALLLMSDDDCLLAPRALEGHVEAHAGARESVVVVGPIELPNDMRDGRVREPFEQVAAVARRVSWINATGANSSIPAAAFLEVGGYNEEIRGYGGEDPDLALRLRQHGLGFRFAATAVAYHYGRQLGGEYLRKAFAAGEAHWRVYRRFPRAEVGLLLGVHPLLLHVKRLLLNGFPGPLLASARVRYERAYLAGALAAKRKDGFSA